MTHLIWGVVFRHSKLQAMTFLAGMRKTLSKSTEGDAARSAQEGSTHREELVSGFIHVYFCLPVETKISIGNHLRSRRVPVGSIWSW